MVTPAITVQDIADRMNDFVTNYTTGSVDLGNRIRAINGAIEYLKRYMTLPSDEVIQKFYFSQNTLYYNLNSDFNEGLFLLYDDPTLNVPRNNWEYAPYGDILRKTGLRPRTNYFSWAPINGKMQLLMYGFNLNQGSTLSTFDSIVLNGYVGQNDADSLVIDNNIFTEGSGSLSFDIDPTLGGTGIASIYWPVNYDFTTVLQKNGNFNLDVWLPSGNLTEINLVLLTDANDYYTLSASTFNDGTAFSTALNTWKTLQFSFVGDAVVGSPAIKNITAMRVDFVLNGSFGSVEIPNFRIDNLYTQFPDYMDFIYLTSNKGTDTTGATNKTFFTEYSDIPAFGLFVPDMIDVIAMRAAVTLAPQILSNAEFRAMYLSESEALIKVVGKSWPRKRVINMGRLVLSRGR